MSNVRKRIEVLERFLKRSSDQRGEMVSRALEHLSMDQLALMREMARESKDGKLGREMTEPELAVTAAFDAAVELECRSAGLSPSVVFQEPPFGLG